MCSRELCVQFVKAHGGGNCLFEGPTGNSENSYRMSATQQTDYSASRIQY